jgi:hypothetical protein
MRSGEYIQLARLGNRLSAILDVEFAEDMIDVFLDSIDTDIQALRNLTIGISLEN